MRRFFLRLLGYPPIGRMALNMMKKRMFRSFEIPLSKALEKQERLLKKKFKRMKGTKIGDHLGIKDGVRLEDLSVTDYSFYEPFFNSPSQDAFMYPLEAYEKVKTSGTAGSEKWFLIPQNFILKSTFETAVPAIMLATHDGEKITLEYGDTVYINTAPRPFAVGVMASLATPAGGKFPLFNLVPNINLPFEDKVNFFINNYKNVDLAVMQASILVSRIIPLVKEAIKLKGMFCPDTAVAEAYFDEITNFAGVPPRTSYNSTETMSCSIPSIQHPLGFILDWRRGIFEFAPVKEGIADENKIIGIDEVEVGEIYEVIYTGLENDLTRYRTLNAFKCVAKGDDILNTDHPVFKFHMRLEKTISLHNFTRISEDELIAAFKESKIPFVEFTARKEFEKGLEYLALYIETTEEIEAEKIKEKVHKRLYASDSDYRDLSDFYGYIPIKVYLMPSGTFAKYLMGKMAAVSKVDRIKMRDEEFNKLLKSAKDTERLVL